MGVCGSWVTSEEASSYATHDALSWFDAVCAATIEEAACDNASFISAFCEAEVLLWCCIFCEKLVQ